MNDMSNELQVINLNKKYGSNHALKNFSVTLTDGIYALLGPNGSGKSTLMNIITNNLKANSGEVLYNGKNIKALGKSYLEVLGYMPQQQGVFDSFTAKRFLYYMASLKGMTKAEANKQIPKLFSLVILEDVMNKRLASFSGGMKQRILLAQAILGNPRVLILDEPTAGLDPKERIRIRNLISEISFNKIVLIATHVVSDIEYISKEVLLLKKGELIDYGRPESLEEKIAGFVFEIKTKAEYLEQISKIYRVGNISKDSDHIYVRVISKKPPQDFEYSIVKPTLQDVYLHIFDK